MRAPVPLPNTIHWFIWLQHIGYVTHFVYWKYYAVDCAEHQVYCRLLQNSFYEIHANAAGRYIIAHVIIEALHEWQPWVIWRPYLIGSKVSTTAFTARVSKRDATDLKLVIMRNWGAHDDNSCKPLLSTDHHLLFDSACVVI